MEGEILFLLLLALIVLGPRRLPEIGRQIGKALAELRRAKYEFSRQIEEEIRSIEREEAVRKQTEQGATTDAATPAEPKILPPRAAPAGTVTAHNAEAEPAPIAASNQS